MARSKSSESWLKEHFDDNYVNQAKAQGYRSRAGFKLLQLDAKDKLLKSGMTVIDLGAAPGSWSQVVAEKIGAQGVLIASDILPMDSLPNTEFVQGDFTEQAVLDEILKKLKNRPVDLVISDMSPNLSGMTSIDQPKAMYLVELALDMAQQVLTPNGHFLAKAFQGEGFEEFMAQIKPMFAKVVIRKPDASRARSKEVYILAKNFNG